MNRIKTFNKYLILIILLTSIYSIKAQDVVCPPPLIIIDTNTSIIQRTQEKFILGWNWGSPINIIKVNSVLLSVAKYPITLHSIDRIGFFTTFRMTSLWDNTTENRNK